MEDLLKLKEVAQLLRLTPQTVYKLIQQGKIVAIKIGNQWRFNKKQIEQWLEENHLTRISAPNGTGERK